MINARNWLHSYLSIFPCCYSLSGMFIATIASAGVKTIINADFATNLDFQSAAIIAIIAVLKILIQLNFYRTKGNSKLKLWYKFPNMN